MCTVAYRSRISKLHQRFNIYKDTRANQTTREQITAKTKSNDTTKRATRTSQDKARTPKHTRQETGPNTLINKTAAACIALFIYTSYTLPPLPFCRCGHSVWTFLPYLSRLVCRLCSCPVCTLVFAGHCCMLRNRF